MNVNLGYWDGHHHSQYYLLTLTDDGIVAHWSEDGDYRTKEYETMTEFKTIDDLLSSDWKPSPKSGLAMSIKRDGSCKPFMIDEIKSRIRKLESELLDLKVELGKLENDSL